MSFDRASTFYMGACHILQTDEAGVTPGERAVAYASLAQVEAIFSLAALIQGKSPDTAARVDLMEAEGILDMAAGLLRQRILGADHPVYEDDHSTS
jgi:hypothetical protein